MLGSRSTSEGGVPGREPQARPTPDRPAAEPAPINARASESLADERALVDRAREGDLAAQGALFDFYWPNIGRYTYSHCRNLHDAEDLASEVFLRMVEAIGRFQWRENVPFTAWLFRIARNQIVSHYRRSGNVVPLIDDGAGDP